MKKEMSEKLIIRSLVITALMTVMTVFLVVFMTGRIDVFADPESDMPADGDGPIAASEITGISKLVCGAQYTVALKNDGSLWSWGSNIDYCLGYTPGVWVNAENGEGASWTQTTYSDSPNKLKRIDDVADVDICGTSILVAKNDGTVWIKKGGIVVFVQVEGLENVRSVSCGLHHYAALTEGGDLYLWGDNAVGQIGDGTTDFKSQPYHLEIDGVSAFKDVSLGTYHNIALTTDGDVYVWGMNNSGQIGDGTRTDRHTPQKLAFEGLNDKIVTVNAGSSSTAAVTENGSLYMWGSQLPDTSETEDIQFNTSITPHIMLDKQDVRDVELGIYHYAILKKNGDLLMWGSNTYHEINDTELSYYGLGLEPVKVLDGTAVQQISLGSGHTGAVKSDGTILMWGDDTYGQLGKAVENCTEAPDSSGTGTGDGSETGDGNTGTGDGNTEDGNTGDGSTEDGNTGDGSTEVEPDLPEVTSVKLKKTVYAYSGKNIKPAAVVKAGTATLKKGVDYTVSYKSQCKKVGKYKVTVRGAGQYAGKFSRILSYTIIPDKVRITRIKTKYLSGTREAIVKIYASSKIKPTKKIYYEARVYKDKKLKKQVGDKKTFYSWQRFRGGFFGIKTKYKRGKTYYMRIRTVSGSYKSKWSKVRSFKIK